MPSQWTPDEPDDEPTPTGQPDPVGSVSARHPGIGPVTDDPGPKILLPPPLTDLFIKPIIGGDPIVITQDGALVDSAYVPEVLDAAARIGIVLREKRA